MKPRTWDRFSGGEEKKNFAALLTRSSKEHEEINRPRLTGKRPARKEEDEASLGRATNGGM